MNQPTTNTTPIMCDLTGARDTGPERMREYQRLFAEHFAGKERTATGIRFRFRADAGVEDWVRDLAAREKECCAFFDFAVTRAGDEVLWDGSVVDDDIARDILEEFYLLPENAPDGLDAFEGRLTGRGLTFVTKGLVTEVHRRADSD